MKSLRYVVRFSISIDHPLQTWYFAPMKIIYLPDESCVQQAIRNDDPLLVLVSFDGEKIIVGNIDDFLEHHILLKQAGQPVTALEEYFRIIVNKTEASWTYICPGTYMNITNREFRLKKYFENGSDRISRALKLLNYDVPIDIPKRYRRHFDALKDE